MLFRKAYRIYTFLYRNTAMRYIIISSRIILMIVEIESKTRNCVIQFRIQPNSNRDYCENRRWHKNGLHTRTWNLHKLAKLELKYCNEDNNPKRFLLRAKSNPSTVWKASSTQKDAGKFLYQYTMMYFSQRLSTNRKSVSRDYWWIIYRKNNCCSEYS